MNISRTKIYGFEVKGIYDWDLWADGRLRSPFAHGHTRVSIGNNKGGTTQFATPSATTLDLGLQWRPRQDLRLNLAVNNVTDQKYWRWANVYGQAANSPVLDAYTQPGRNIKIAFTADFLTISMSKGLKSLFKKAVTALFLFTKGLLLFRFPCASG